MPLKISKDTSTNSLRLKMTIMIVLVVLVSSGLMSFISYKKARESMSSQTEAAYGIAADKYAQELTAWINSNATLIDTMAAEIQVSGIYEDREAFHLYLQDSCLLLNDNGYIFDIYFTYPDNTMACASDFVADGTVDYVHDRAWYTNAAETGELCYSTPYCDYDSKKPIITISKAVYSADGLQGVLAADIFVDTLVDIISEADVAPDSYAFLVDSNMGMIVHPNEEYDFDDTPLGIMDVADAPYEEVIENIRSGSHETVFVEDYDGVTRGIVVSRMENTGWYVGIATSRAELMKDVGGLIRGFLIAAVVAVLTGGLFAVFLAQMLDRMSKQRQQYEAHVLKLEKQAAYEASKAKSRFLADMSHEIRTPINAILGMNEMIIRETDNSDILGYSRNIRQSGHNLLQLVNSILDFSKIEDGKMEIVPGRYNVGTQISYCVNSISERARAKDLELICNVDPELPSELYGDDTRINEIIMNLLTNAVKYTDRGSVTLTVKAKERRIEPEDSVLVYVEVKDTGIGIKESEMNRLFESFERLDVVRNRNIEGTGLGISITTRLLELMGSSLQVESTYGEGSRFFFELWQKIEDAAPLGDFREAAGEPEEDVYKEIFRASSAEILIVDDTKMNIAVVVNLLKKTAVKTDTALSGPEAVAMAETKAYDLILMDQRMPGMDGTEAMKKIRSSASGKNRNTPVICLTADVIRGARERYIAEGFDDYLTKPVDGRLLEKMLLKYLPAEKIQTDRAGDEEDASAGGGSDAALFAGLAGVGIDTSTGMFFCQNDREMYKAILAEYCQEEKSKSLNLQDCYRRKDWKNYGIYVHSLKSTSKTIGAQKLFELAASLEAAAGTCDEEILLAGHGRVMEMYQKIVSSIEANLGTSDDLGSDDEVFEFLPEENGDTDD